MSQIVVKYRLLNPKSRPNPFTINHNVVFKDGICTLVIEHDNVAVVDKTMSNYGAERVKDEVDGESEDEADGSDGVGETDASGDLGDGGEQPPVAYVDRFDNDEGDKGDAGSEAPGNDGQSAEVPVVTAEPEAAPAPTPRKTRTKKSSEDDLV